ncbi:MAG: C_GCAxxG_C_C family protein [Oscillospiraceae bacterium]|nr:C_GCAxxG_C_C family protein [Oscillospiraceae bacterium]
MTKKERCIVAHDCHASGLNCAQSVAAAFSDLTGLSKEQSIALCSGFGGGMRYGGVCGVVSAAVMVLGAVFPATAESGAEGKSRAGQITMEYERRFVRHFASLDCRELKANPVGEGTDMAKELHAANHCRMLVVSGTELLHDMIEELKEK